MADSTNVSVTPGIYKHFKGNEYQVLGVAVHTETGEKLVAYRPLSDFDNWYVRPLHMFIEEVELEDGTVVPRFEKLSA